MESILVLTHTDETGSALTKASLEAVAAGQELAQRLGAPLSVGIVGAPELLNAVAATGAKFFAVSGDAFTQPRYATDAAALEALCRAAQATIVLLPQSSRPHAGSIASALRPLSHARPAPGSCCSTPEPAPPLRASLPL